MTFSIEKLKEIATKISDKEIKSVLNIIKIEQGQSIMDLGAGAGVYTLAFSKEVGEDGLVYAVDTNHEITDYIDEQVKEQKLNNVKTIESHTPHYPIEKGSLDKIFSRNVFHHLPNQVNFLNELKTYLKEGGQLIIIDHKKGSKIPGHEHDLFDVDEVLEIGNKAGFTKYQVYQVHKQKIFIIFNK